MAQQGVSRPVWLISLSNLKKVQSPTPIPNVLAGCCMANDGHPLPIPSMYGIFTYICLIFMVHGLEFGIGQARMSISDFKILWSQSVCRRRNLWFARWWLIWPNSCSRKLDLTNKNLYWLLICSWSNLPVITVDVTISSICYFSGAKKIHCYKRGRVYPPGN